MRCQRAVLRASAFLIQITITGTRIRIAAPDFAGRIISGADLANRAKKYLVQRKRVGTLREGEL